MTNSDFNNEAEDSTSLLGLARKIHDEHVAEGRAIADKLISEAKTKAEDIVASAQSNTQARAEKVEELIAFEAVYRAKLQALVDEASALLADDSEPATPAPVASVSSAEDSASTDESNSSRTI